jgi:Rrf2 family nitric oxide-sensitive transcriptional repressor
MRLTLFTDYCLRTLMYLSQHSEKRCTAREIADNYGISQNHIAKVVHRLSQLGYIESVKGKGGGVRLRGKPEHINLWAVVQALEPDFTLMECFDKAHNTCRIVSACGLKVILRDALQAFGDTLAQYSITDAISQPKLFATLLSPGPKKESK